MAAIGTQTSSRRRIKRVDVHHHIFPATLPKKELNAKAGWRAAEGTLPWSPEVSLAAMDALDIDIAILSYPTGFPSGPPGPDNRALARELNLQAKKICEKYPDRFGFFACLPDLRDIEGALEEIAYALGHLHADGIGLWTCYGEGSEALYIGHDKFDPIWNELNRRKAVVHLHGTQTPSSTPYPHEFLGIPITEVPNETYKAAAHLVVTGKKRRYADVKIILAHLGGSMPFLAPRVAVLSNHMGCELSPEEILQDFKSFYFDTALSAYESTLDVVKRFVNPERLFFGTDFPAVGNDMAGWYTKQLTSYYAEDTEELEKIMAGNAGKVFPRFFGND
ncbi:unnamed protein product [Somion occarium]|uniref:6-methylsalicylate decarboxylase n=1 Tax=Somion occarium TaxID=3059160 RepID=A0ABP1D206_9APHY